MKRLFRVNDWSLAVKLVVAMTLVSVVALSVAAIASITASSRQLESQIGDEMVSLAELEGTHLGSLLEAQLTALQSAVASDDDILDAVETQNESYTGSEQEILEGILALDAEWQAETADGTALINRTLHSAAADELADFIEVVPDQMEVFATDRYGANVASSGQTSDYYQADEEWWQAAWNNGQGDIYFSLPTFDESAGVAAFEIAMPITDENTGEVIGVLKGVYNVAGLTTALANFQLGETGDVHVFNADGIIIAEASGAAEAAGTSLEESLRLDGRTFSGSGFASSAVGHEGNTVVVGYAPVATVGGTSAVDETGWVVQVVQDRAEAFASIRQLRIISAVTTNLAALAAAGAALLLARFLTRQVREIDKLFRAAAVGDFEARAQVLGNDELGQTAEGVNALLSQLTTLFEETTKAAQQRFSDIGMLGWVFETDIEGRYTYCSPLFAEALGYTAEEMVGKTPFDFMLPEEAERSSAIFSEVLADQTSVVDLEAWTRHKDGQLVSLQLNAVPILSDEDELLGYRGAIKDITAQKHVVAGVASAATEVTSATSSMAEVIQLMVDQAARSAQVAEQAAASAREGNQLVFDTVAAMTRIRDNTQETARRIKRLGEVSQEIGESVRLIEELSDRTTVLALNASIQAAAAGEAGRGFAVVAEEVQRLAERATGATRQIEDLVKSIQAEMNEAVFGIEDATREVVEGSQLADKAGERMIELNAVADELARLIQHVAETTSQQTNESLDALTDMSQGLQASVAALGVLPEEGSSTDNGHGALAVATAGDGVHQRKV